jgi:hypothetical protein
MVMTRDLVRPYEADSEVSLAHRLERGEIALFPTCPFALPAADDRRFLLEQRVGSPVHKNISYDPQGNVVTGFRRQSLAAERRLRRLLADFSRNACHWLAHLLPGYARGWQLDRVSFRPEEEAIRALRQTARNDLLHVASFPTRPSHGRRILRLYVNIHPTDPRVWVTSEPFSRLVERFGRQLGLALPPWSRRVLGLLPGRPVRSDYDDFMLRLHHFLKSNDDFQERAPKRYWSFPPGSAWLLFADGISHAELRGRFALEHSFFVARDCLAVPDQAPAAILERLRTGSSRAA